MAGGPGRKISTNRAIAKGERSEHRKAVGENTAQKQGLGNNQKQNKGKDAKNTTGVLAAGTSATRSASRNAGASIVNLEDYKSGKGEGTHKNHNQGAQNTNRPVSKARNLSSQGRSEYGSNPTKSSSQRSAGTSNREHQPSPHRRPSRIMESKNETAASRETDKYLTKWEAQQQINKRNANIPTETVNRSESRESEGKDS